MSKVHPPSAQPQALTLDLFSPSGRLARPADLGRARRYLESRGFAVQVDEGASLKFQRFAGTDEQRLDAIHRVAQRSPSVALASRGGYGLTRLLHRIDWGLIERSLDAGTRWVGYSDFTAFHLALLARQGASSVPCALWSGPMACGDFGSAATEVDDVTADCFVEAMHGELEGIGFRTQAGHDGLEVEGPIWGGNLSLITSLLGTPYLPNIQDGILFLEEVGELTYRSERLLWQLAHAGVLDRQKAILLGAVSNVPKSPLDKGYGPKTLVAQLQSMTRTPVLTGLPFGHIPTKVCLPLGTTAQLAVLGRDVWMAW